MDFLVVFDGIEKHDGKGQRPLNATEYIQVRKNNHNNIDMYK